MAAFAARYGFLPAPDFAWPMFTNLVQRLGQFEARDLLGGLLSATAASAAGPFSSRQAREALQQNLKRLEHVAGGGDEGGSSPAARRRQSTPLNRD